MRWLVVAVFMMSAPTAFASVVINEIAWMGTADSSSNEWIELANDGDSADLTGWILRIEGKKDITLSGSIPAREYYLIERTDDNTVPGIPADLITSFSTGLSNDGAVLVLLNASGAEVDRMNGSDGWKISGEVVGNNTAKEPAGRTGSGWATLSATPRAQNSGVSNTPPATTQNTSVSSGSTAITATPTSASFPVDPQIYADAGPQSRIVLVGAPTTFSGSAFGLKKEPIENARFVWGFGDGGVTEGKTVVHTSYYPGEYTAVLDVASGYYAASDRVYVTAISPNFILHTGGDTTRSFIALENKTSNELDLSLWQVSVNGKNFTLPKNTILGARKTLTLPSEITGLVAPSGSLPQLLFPNGFPVKSEGGEVATLQNPEKYSPPVGAQVLRTAPAQTNTQKASVVDVDSDTETSLSLGGEAEENTMWPWFTGVAFLGAFALLAFRATRSSDKKEDENEDEALTADDFEILEDEEENLKQPF